MSASIVVILSYGENMWDGGQMMLIHWDWVSVDSEVRLRKGERKVCTEKEKLGCGPILVLSFLLSFSFSFFGGGRTKAEGGVYNCAYVGYDMSPQLWYIFEAHSISPLLHRIPLVHFLVGVVITVSFPPILSGGSVLY